MENKIFTARADAEKETRVRAAIVGMTGYDAQDDDVEKSLDELTRLLDTAGADTVFRLVQNKATPDPRYLLGSGKVAELAVLCHMHEIALVVFDMDLSPSQIRNLEDAVSSEQMPTRVIDRSMLILDIFALHAVTGEGKLQVELAQLKYTAPRLSGHGTEMSRLGGGIGTRGPGETKLESDRRHMQRRIYALEEELRVMEKNRKTMRASRDRSGCLKIAIVGYTNAGKSTLLNRLTDAGILAEDKLFATLDPTTRKYRLPCGEEVLLTDTVGFIRKLPHHLVNAFRSTLDEAVYADVLLILVDASDPEAAGQLEVTESLLRDLGASGKPTIYAFNKCDRGIATFHPSGLSDGESRKVYLSALTGQGVEQLVDVIEEIVLSGKRRVTYRIPNSEAGALSRLYAVATVEEVDYGADAITVVAMADAKARGQMKKYAVEPEETEDSE
ncbi:MAG: GTPase HflX [Clostridia bacterium]|nr:GTPase HflX [Clostridia bacterium]